MRVKKKNNLHGLENQGARPSENFAKRLFKYLMVKPFVYVKNMIHWNKISSHSPPIFRDRKIRLGAGSGGFVNKVECQNQEMAYKKVNDSQKEREAFGLPAQERAILAKLDHPHIIKGFLGEKDDTVICVTEKDLDGNFEETTSEKAEYIEVEGVDTFRDGILTELASCGLDKVIKKLPKNRKRHAMDLLSAVSYLHNQKICHMDIKPQNILWSKQKGVMLCDFDAAVKVSKSGKLPPEIKKPVFTPLYAAPELIRAYRRKDPSKLNGRACDSWSLGCTLAELITGERVFNPVELKRKKGDFTSTFEGRLEKKVDNYLNKHKKNLDADMYRVLKGMLNTNPQKRLGVRQAFVQLSRG